MRNLDNYFTQRDQKESKINFCLRFRFKDLNLLYFGFGREAQNPNEM